MAYVKTDWKNKPDMSTPINATNLNKIEDGIYNNDIAITNLKPVVLYSNYSGTQGTVTLSDTIYNYNYIDLIVADRDYTVKTSYFRFDVNTMGNTMGLSNITSYENSVKIITALVSFSDNIISWVTGQTNMIIFNNTEFNITNDNLASIFKVIGYKS